MCDVLDMITREDQQDFSLRGKGVKLCFVCLTIRTIGWPPINLSSTYILRGSCQRKIKCNIRHISLRFLLNSKGKYQVTVISVSLKFGQRAISIEVPLFSGISSLSQLDFHKEIMPWSLEASVPGVQALSWAYSMTLVVQHS